MGTPPELKVVHTGGKRKEKSKPNRLKKKSKKTATDNNKCVMVVRWLPRCRGMAESDVDDFFFAQATAAVK